MSQRYKQRARNLIGSDTDLVTAPATVRETPARSGGNVIQNALPQQGAIKSKSEPRTPSRPWLPPETPATRLAWPLYRGSKGARRLVYVDLQRTYTGILLEPLSSTSKRVSKM